MNFSCIFLLAFALFGAVSQAYVTSGSLGYGSVGTVGPVGTVGAVGAVGPVGTIGTVGTMGTMGAIGYNGVYDNAYGAGYETGYGCRTTCAPVCGPPAVCDNCQCVKTIVRPNIIERIPYSCSRRIQASACRTGCGLYAGAGYVNGGYMY